MKKILLCISVIFIITQFITSCSSNKSEITPLTYPEINNQILYLILKWTDNHGRYIVVEPETLLDYSDYIYNKYLNDITSKYNTDDYDFTALVNQLFELNNKYKRLTLKSSIKDGYYVDYNDKFDKYFVSYSIDSWENLYKENPNVLCMTTVSIPAYDPVTGYVIFCRAEQRNYLTWHSDIYIYKYYNGNLSKIGSIEEWSSSFSIR